MDNTIAIGAAIAQQHFIGGLYGQQLNRGLCRGDVVRISPTKMDDSKLLAFLVGQSRGEKEELKGLKNVFAETFTKGQEVKNEDRWGLVVKVLEKNSDQESTLAQVAILGRKGQFYNIPEDVLVNFGQGTEEFLEMLECNDKLFIDSLPTIRTHLHQLFKGCEDVSC